VTDTHRFRTTIEPARGGGGAVARVPVEVAEQIGGLKQMRVFGTINGAAYKSSTMPWGDRQLYMLVTKAMKSDAGADFGDEVEIELTKDDSPRVLELAPEFEAALAADPVLRARFDAMSFSRRRLLADPITQAAKPETRRARLERALATLREAT
jgi:hypothetical protein